MHIAVSKGVHADQGFMGYVQFLLEKHYIPPDAKSWVDQIRIKSNEANHEITVMTREDAEDLMSFCHMLLKVIFEFPAIVRKRSNPHPPAS